MPKQRTGKPRTMKKARDVMTEGPATCTLNDSIYEAVRIMEMNDCGAVPIVDMEERCVGIVTDRDICLYLGLSQGPVNPRQLKLDEVMTDSPVSCAPEESMETVIAMMEENQVRRVPVVDRRGKLVGIIAQADIALMEDSCELVQELVEEISK